MEKLKNVQENKGTSISRANIEEKAENNVGAGLDQPEKENVSMKNVGAGFHPCPQKNKGITLIALIITIIVMLILVMVSIQVLFNTGLFDAAGKATQKWNAEQEKEANMQITIGNKIYGSVEDYISGKDEEAPEPTDSKYFKFTYDEETKTASIDGIKDEYCLWYEYYEESYEGGIEEYSGYESIYIKDGDIKITDIVIPSKVEKDGVEYEVNKISASAFAATYLESEITSVYIPNTVTSIERTAFYGCISLRSINVPAKVTSIEDGTFARCISLTSIKIPDNVTIIGGSAFRFCYGLESIEIPDSVTSIGSSAFSDCSSLTSVTIGDSVTSIRNSAFSGCSSLTSVTIGDSVTGIGNSAFSGCSSLTSVTIGDSVTSIGDSAFSGCSSLTSIEVDVENKIYDSRENCNALIETSTNQLILGCKNTIIPTDIVKIGDHAFSGCIGLTNIEIPQSVTVVEDYAFSGCARLTTVVIPTLLSRLGTRCIFWM